MTRSETDEVNERALRSGIGTVPGVWAFGKVGVGRYTALRMLRDGTAPFKVLRNGRAYRVPVASLRKVLDLPAEPAAAGSVAS